MSLTAVLAEACDWLADAARDPAAPLRTITLGTVNEDGAPDLRSVILRDFDAASRRLSVHTDSRSAKFAQIRRRPVVAVHGWDPARRVQLRLSGLATLHAGDPIADAAWRALSPFGRQLYRVRQAPGDQVPDPSPHRYSEVPEAEAYAWFSVIVVACHELEVLRLSGHGQTRARFTWQGERHRAEWLVP